MSQDINFQSIKQCLDPILRLADTYKTFCLTFDNYRGIRKNATNGFNNLLAIGEKSHYSTLNEAFSGLETYIKKCDSKIFGHFGYDLKNQTDDLQSNNTNHYGFSDIHFFEPTYVLQYKLDEIPKIKTIPKGNFLNPNTNSKKKSGNLILKKRTTKSTYLKNVKKLISHIKNGDIYEINYTQEFYIENIDINPIDAFLDLLKNSAAPFSTLYKVGENYAICASPERFLKIEKDVVISQPIKGTAEKNLSEQIDFQIRNGLLTSQKERSENIMTVDVVRNDLSKTAVENSVKVRELCKLYSFEKLHHLVSTVESKISTDMSQVEVIKNAFPIASMTGAPKINAMKFIEDYENVKRGLYSGSIGYFDLPNKSCDFNVVIRTIQYDRKRKYLSFSTGGAITSQSNPEKEYEECFIKAKSILDSLNISLPEF